MHIRLRQRDVAKRDEYHSVSMKKTFLVSLIALFLLAGLAYADTITSLNTVFSQIEQIYNLPPGILAKIAHVESGGNPNATGGNAAGLFQWLPGSWIGASRALFCNSANSDQTECGGLNVNKRFSPVTSAKVTAFALAQARDRIGGLIQQAGVDMTLGLYMSHFLGIAGAQHFLQAYIQSPNALAASIFPREASANPSVFGGRTLAQLLNYEANKLQVAPPSINIAGNYSDANGISLAYSYADVAPGDFYPAGYVAPKDTYYTYPTTYTPANQSQGLVAPAQLVQPISVPRLQTAAPTTATQTTGTTVGTGAASGSASGVPSAVSGISPVAIVLAQPQNTALGNPVLVSWTSVGMSTQSPCMLALDGTQATSSNAGSQIFSTKTLSAGPHNFVLSCISLAGQAVTGSAVVTLH